MKKSPPLTSDVKAMFLRVLAQKGGNVTAACRSMMITVASAKRAKDKDAEFAKGWSEAIEIGNILLEDEARRRAIDGVEKPIFWRGIQISTVREYSDGLLKFILSRRNKEIFGDRVTLEGGDKPIKIEHEVSQAIQDKFDEMYD